MSKRSIPVPLGKYIAASDIQVDKDLDLREQLRAKFVAKAAGQLLVGIAWKGASRKKNVPYMVNLLDWGPILHVPGITFVNLQPGDCSIELAAAVKGFGISIVHNEVFDPFKDTNRYAATIAAMGVIVAPESDAAAIAAAFGVPVLCMALPSAISGLTSLPETQIFTQQHSGEWFDVIRDVGLALLDHTVKSGATAKRSPYLRSMAQDFTKMGRLEDAEHLYRCLAMEPGLTAEGLFQIASLRHRTGRREDALRLFDEALAEDSAFWHAYNGKGLTLASLNRYDEAITSYRQGLILNPRSGEIHNNLGTSLRCLGRAAEALPHYRQAIELLPDIASIRLNEASALDESGDSERALRAFDKLVLQNPEYVDAHYNRSQILLSNGRLEEGWKELIWRLKRPAANARYDIFPQPVWKSGSLSGKRILVWTEQGIGDELLAASMIPDAIAAAEHVTLLCSERLLPLMRRSFPAVTVEHRAEPLPACAVDPSIDLQLSLSELGLAFRQNFAAFPMRSKFLKADQHKQDSLRAKYQAHRPGARLVGISWMSQKNYELGWLKSQSLLSWAPILSTPRVLFVNLQYGDRQQELEKVRKQLGIELLHDDSIDPLVDMDGFAAQVAAMDLVVSASNTTVHTAGALGVPVWVLAAKGRGRFWYWFRGKTDCPWYPSAHFITQEKEGDWSSVLNRCSADLMAWSQEKAELP